jgi:UDP-glucuronate 4-epimerase
MTVLITGVAGFIGMHSAIKFIDSGYDVIGIDNMSDYYSVELKHARLTNIKNHPNILAKKSEFEFINQDINSGILDKLVSREITVVLHLAAQAGVRYSVENPKEYTLSNIVGFQNILEFVRAASISQFIYASSSSVYGKRKQVPFKEIDRCDNPESFYACTKLCNELMAKAYSNVYGMNSIGLRFFTVYGPWGRPDMAPFKFVNAALNDNKIEVYNYGNQQRDFTYIDDIVDAIYLLVTSKKQLTGAEVYNIGKGEPVGLMPFIEAIERYTEKIINKQFVRAQTGDVEITYSSIDKLQKEIHFKPCTSLDQGISRLIPWYRDYYDLNVNHNES